MSSPKEALIGSGIGMILLYFILITIVKSIDEVVFNIIMDFGILIAGIITIIVGITMGDN